MSLIYAPDGTAINTERPVMHWPLEYMRMLAIFAANCEEAGLGLHCSKCKQPLQGHNAKSDNFWHMECACRKYIGRNPLPTAQKQANA